MRCSFDPVRYADWFESPLGRRVWADEREALNRVLGNVAGWRMLDAGAGDCRLSASWHV